MLAVFAIPIHVQMDSGLSDIEATAPPYPSLFSCLRETLIIVVHKDTAN